MDQSYAPSKLLKAARSWKAGGIRLLLVLATMAVSLYLAIKQVSRPAPVSSSAPASEFSSGRAKKHIEVIAQSPRPVGSVHHAVVRDYIFSQLSAMGLEPRTQEAQVMAEWGAGATGASVANILARLPGMSNTKAILLVAHYDSAPTSCGASDDGAGVATLIETARVLKSGPPLRNDVLLLFTDAEEIGLLGARAFVEDKSATEAIGVVFNFEARGNSGPSVMFETSDNNGWLIDNFAKVSPYPVTSSFSNEIYKRLPNDTDLSVFKKAGLAGLNFAYIKGVAHYHTALDTAENLDEASLQHHGSYALALARHFGGLSIGRHGAGDQVYFNTIGSIVVRYPESFAMIVAIIDALLFLAVAVYSLKRKRISISGALLALPAFLLTVVITTVIVVSAWQLMRSTQSQYEWAPNGSPRNSGLQLAGLTALAVAIFSALYALYLRKTGPHSLTVGALLGWLILTSWMTLSAPGGSYLFAWPLFFALISAALLAWSGDNEDQLLTDATALAILAIPAVAIVVPMAYLLFLGLGLEATGVIVALEALLLGLLMPQISFWAGRRKWLIASAATLIGIGLTLSAVLRSGFDAEHPKANSIFYVINADSGKAVWASFDQRPDEWTSQFLSSNPSRGDLTAYAPIDSDNLLRNETRAMALIPPSIILLGGSANAGIRTLRLRLSSARQAPLLEVSIEPDVGVVSARVGGKLIKPGRDRRWRIRYYGAGDEGIEITLEVNSPQPVKIRAMDVTYGLPDVEGLIYSPRQENMVAVPRAYSDSVIVSKSFSF